MGWCPDAAEKLKNRRSEDRRFPSGLDGVCRSDRLADRVQDVADLAAQEDEGDDRDDRDEGEDQRVLRETLAFLVIASEVRDDGGKQIHVMAPPFLQSSPDFPRAASPYA